MGKNLEGNLPDKLSELIRVALKDEARVAKSPKYRINMGTWHNPNYDDGVCEVCLAGAVMAGTLGARPTASYVPSQWSAHIAHRLEALDYIRGGDIQSALVEGHFLSPRHSQRVTGKALGIAYEIRRKISDPPMYYRFGNPVSCKRREWRRWMFKCARELEARGF